MLPLALHNPTLRAHGLAVNPTKRGYSINAGLLV